MDKQTIALVGGTGFVGQNLASELARRGYRIRIITRNRERVRELLVIPNLEQVEADIHDLNPSKLQQTLAGCDAIINLCGVLHTVKGNDHRSFEAVHVSIPRKLGDAAVRLGIQRILHISALGASPNGQSEYLKSKYLGEQSFHNRANIHVTSIRPAVIFGPGDSFFNLFAKVLKLSPGVVFLACPKAQLAPVYVVDLARAMADILERKDTIGKHLEFEGPKRYTLSQLVTYLAKVMGLNRRIIGLGDGLSKLQASVLQSLPGQLFTMDNYQSLITNAKAHDNAFDLLGIQPTSVESVLPTYIGEFAKANKYRELRKVGPQQQRQQ